MKHEDVRRLLDRVGILRGRCDLDLLLFFVRHPRTLITSEQLAAWLGYDLKQIAESLEVLLDGGIVTRMLNPTHAARLYIFAIGPTTGGGLPALLEHASTREGRLAILEELSRRAADHGPVARVSMTAITPRSRPFPVARKPSAPTASKVG